MERRDRAGPIGPAPLWRAWDVTVLSREKMDQQSLEQRVVAIEREIADLRA